MNDPITWGISIIALLGAITNTQKWVISYWFYVIANFCWMIWAYYYKVWPLFMLFSGFEATSIYGLYRWSKDRKI